MAKTEQEFKKLFAENMALFRKKSGLTQFELAEKINYSDKTVSKWERGEGLPDLYVLSQMAEILSVSPADFLSEKPESVKSKKLKEEMAPLSKRTKFMITALAVGLVWLFAALVFFVLSLVNMPAHYLGLVFYCAIPVSAIVATVFSMLWFSRLASGLSVAALIWSTAFGAFYYIALGAMKYVFVLAAALTVLEVLWYIYLYLRSRDKKKQKKQTN